METEFDALEARLHQLLQTLQTVRAENLSLRQQLAAAREQEKQLDGKLNLVRQRLNTLAERIPAEKA